MLAHYICRIVDQEILEYDINLLIYCKQLIYNS